MNEVHPVSKNILETISSPKQLNGYEKAMIDMQNLETFKNQLDGLRYNISFRVQEKKAEAEAYREAKRNKNQNEAERKRVEVEDLRERIKVMRADKAALLEEVKRIERVDKMIRAVKA